MPVDLIDRDAGTGVVLVGSGTVTAKELGAAHRRLYTNERLGRLRYRLIDLTAIDRFVVTADEVARIAEQDRAAARLRPGLLFAVAADDDRVFGLSRMWAALVDDGSLETNVSRTREAAEAWLANRRGAENA